MPWAEARRAIPAMIITGMMIMVGCTNSTERPIDTEESPVGFTNPVYASNFPDPLILTGPDGAPTEDGQYWAYATNGNGANVQTLTSKDLITWEQGPDALPKLPDWSTPGKVWAPEVIKHPDGRYLMYYTTRAPEPDHQCVGLAIGDAPGGPFVDDHDGPLICESEQGGSIDAHPYVDRDGNRYLYWKNDGNHVGVDSYISVQRLDETGTELVGEPRQLFKQDQPWEGPLVEGPFLWERGGTYFMFYSGNGFTSPDYAVGIATADNPLGPFTKQPEPILVANDVAAGPGHNALFAKDGRVWMVYHGWAPDAVGESVPGRMMWLSEVTFGDDGSVSVEPPRTDYPIRP